MTRLVTSGELDHLTAERVWQEVFRAMTESKYPNRFFEVLELCGATRRIWPMLSSTNINFVMTAVQASTERGDWALSNEGAKFGRIAIAIGVTDPHTVSTWMESMKAPRFFMDVAEISSKAFNMLLGDMSGRVWTVDKMFDLFVMTHSLKHEEIFDAVIGALRLSEQFGLPGAWRSGVDKAVEIVGSVRAIGFADLSADQQKTLKGPEIGKAIVELRKNHIAKLLQA